MKTLLGILIFSFFVTLSINAQITYQISADGKTFSPDIITIQKGDFIKFTVGSSHPIVEVSEETWNANEPAPIDGGFTATTGTETVEFTEAGTFYYVCQNHVSSGMKGIIIVEETTGIKEDRNAHFTDFSVYPNPIDQYTYLDFDLNKQELVTISLYNLLGSKIKVLYNQVFPVGNYHLSLNFSDLPYGIYYLNIETEKAIHSIKLVKQ